jgi:NodT family efflux transporter outer membrane factor (OMF) lipoprotein
MNNTATRPAGDFPFPVTRGLVAIVACLMVAACAGIGTTPTRAARQDPDQLQSASSLDGVALSAAAWPKADWWTQLKDPQLDRLIGEALAGNPGLKVAQARVRQAQAAAQASGAALYPQVSADAQITRLRYPEFGLIPPPLNGNWNNQAQVQASASYDLDLWGGNRAALASAVGRQQAAEVDAFAARLALSVDIARAYVALDRGYRQLDVAERTLAEREHVYRLTQDRFDAGIDTRLAVKQAESLLPATREQVAQLHEQIELAQTQIAALLGQGPDRGRAITRPSSEGLADLQLPSKVPAVLVGRRPDLVAQRWRVEAASRDIDVARAQFYPNVSLDAFVGLQSIGLSDFLQAGSRTIGAGPALTLPIFNGGRLRGNLAQRDAEYDLAVERYNEALVQALRDVVDQLSAWRSVDEQRRQQALALATAQEAYDLAMLRFSDGIGNYLDVLSAESLLLAQQSLDVELHARTLAISIDLARALGGGFDGTNRL